MKCGFHRRVAERSSFLEISCGSENGDFCNFHHNISETLENIWLGLLLATNRKLHTSVQLVPISMIVNDAERWQHTVLPYTPVLFSGVSQWNAWPATGRSVLQDLRSCAILQASLALSPVSSSICCTHVRQGRPRWRFHSGLMFCLPPVRVSTARRSAEWAGVASGTRCTWPKMESRLRQIRIAKPSSTV